MDAREAIAKLTEKLCDMEYQALGRDYTRDELATMAEIEGAIAARKKELPANGPLTKPGPRSIGHSSSGPFKSFGEQLQAVFRAGMPGGRLTNGCTRSARRPDYRKPCQAKVDSYFNRGSRENFSSGCSRIPRRSYPASRGYGSERTSTASISRWSTRRAAQRAAAWAVCKRIGSARRMRRRRASRSSGSFTWN